MLVNGPVMKPLCLPGHGQGGCALFVSMLNVTADGARNLGVPTCLRAGDLSVRNARAGDTPGIVVGNAQPALIDWTLEQKQIGDAQTILTDKPHAHGILEGLARHGLY